MYYDDLISRYLDGELTPDEETSFHRLLSASPEAREALREMQAIRRAARRMPSITPPPASVESHLFQRLFAEESPTYAAHTEGAAEAAADRSPAPRPSALFARRVRRLVPTLALFLTTLGGAIWFGLSSGDPAESIAFVSTVERPVAPPSSTPVDPSPNVLTRNGSSASTTADGVGSGATGRADASTAARTERGRQAGSIRSGSTDSQPDGTSTEAQGLAQGTNNAATNDLVMPNENVGTQVPDMPAFDTEIADNHAPDADLDRDPGRNAELPSLSRAGVSESIAPALLPALPASGSRDADDNYFAVALRSGLSVVDGGIEDRPASDVAIRVEKQFGERHRVTLAVANSPVLVARTTISQFAGIESPDSKGSGTMASNADVDTRDELSDEVWGGVGYDYALLASRNVRVEAGAGIGYGHKTLRLSVELPVRYRITRKLSLDVIPTLSRVLPHNSEKRIVGPSSSFWSWSGFAVETEETPAFTSAGLQIGVTVDIGK